MSLPIWNKLSNCALLQRFFGSFHQKHFTLKTNFQNHLRHIQTTCNRWQNQVHYTAINDKLQTVPYENLLNKGYISFRSDLIQEDSKALTDALSWCSQVFDYNVKDGKKIRGVALLKAYYAFSLKLNDSACQQWDSEGWKLAVMLAWCVEMLQAFFVVCDDIMDNSKLRRGKPCWYTKTNVGLCAINDSLLLQCGIYKILKKYFGDSKCYSNILDEFLQVTHITVYGQCLDMLYNPINDRPRFENFTSERYQTLVEYKTSHYTFCLPVHLAMHLVGGCSEEDFRITQDLCLKLGLYFQSRDDYLDCFGSPDLTGKFGNDIREGKCTWFAVRFLENAEADVKKCFIENYGIDEERKIAAVLDMYKSSHLLSHYQEFENKLHAEIVQLINSLDDTMGGLFYNLYSQIYKREK